MADRRFEKCAKVARIHSFHGQFGSPAVLRRANFDDLGLRQDVKGSTRLISHSTLSCFCKGPVSTVDISSEVVKSLSSPHLALLIRHFEDSAKVAFRQI